MVGMWICCVSLFDQGDQGYSTKVVCGTMDNVPLAIHDVSTM